MENYRLIAATLTAAIDIVKARPPTNAGTHAVRDGLEITSSVNPIANAIPPSNVATNTPVICPLIIDHESEEPTSFSVVINVPKNVADPIPVNINEPHCNALLCVDPVVGIAGPAAVPVPVDDIL